MNGGIAMYSKIVVAFDGSPQSMKALEQAIVLASQTTPCRLEVLHVVSYPTWIVGEAFMTASPNMRITIMEESERIVEMAEAALKDKSFYYSVHVLEGRPADCIVQFAEEYNCKLIVIGSHGYTGLKEFVLGSVSHNVIQHAKIPVHVVK
jgi:nucleotide-binding universal stress UspA family protein